MTKLKGYFKILTNKRIELNALKELAKKSGWGKGEHIIRFLSLLNYVRYNQLIGQIDGMRIGRRYSLKEK